MAWAGFDPQQSVALLGNMAAAGGGQLPEFLSTYPAHGSRIEELQQTWRRPWQPIAPLPRLTVPGRVGFWVVNHPGSET